MQQQSGICQPDGPDESRQKGHFEAMLDLILQTSANAIIASSFTAIFAVGLVLIFGIAKVVNFAHGELYMAGAYTVWFLYSENNVPFPIAVFMAIVVAVLIGLFMEVALFRWKRGDELGGLILSVGMLMVLQVAAIHLFGQGLMKNVTTPLKGSLQVFGMQNFNIPYQRLLVFGVAGVSLILLWLLLQKTRTGWALRACADDPEAAALQGISINRFALIAMGISAAMAGVGGAMMAPLVQVDPTMGHAVIINGLIVIIVGGVGSISGAVLAAVLFSFFHTFVTTFAGGIYADIFGMIIMLLILVAKPTGIMGTHAKV
ncbi:MAG: branched-chain amino acid ABC transporter permease [Aestuariivirga sp.]|nr:branched-chain amino acid ABC transporter permease [Aestuariivirga sp.]